MIELTVLDPELEKDIQIAEELEAGLEVEISEDIDNAGKLAAVRVTRATSALKEAKDLFGKASGVFKTTPSVANHRELDVAATGLRIAFSEVAAARGAELTWKLANPDQK